MPSFNPITDIFDLLKKYNSEGVICCNFEKHNSYGTEPSVGCFSLPREIAIASTSAQMQAESGKDAYQPTYTPVPSEIDIQNQQADMR